MSARLDLLKQRLQQYLDAEAAITGGAQEYSVEHRRLTRANLKDIAEMIKYLEDEISKQTNVDAGRGARRMFGAVPRDI